MNSQIIIRQLQTENTALAKQLQQTQVLAARLQDENSRLRGVDNFMRLYAARASASASNATPADVLDAVKSDFDTIRAHFAAEAQAEKAVVEPAPETEAPKN